MVVMVAVDSWLLGHVSTIGIVYVFYGINLFFGININASIKSIRPVRTVGRIPTSGCNIDSPFANVTW